MKPFEEFYSKARSKDGRQPSCIECQRARAQVYYRANPKPIIEKAKANRVIMKTKYEAWKSSQRCVDCGETRTVLLDCDHVRGEKVDNVAAMVRQGRSWAAIEAEIAKCEVRCVVCHRLKTSEQFDWASR